MPLAALRLVAAAAGAAPPRARGGRTGARRGCGVRLRARAAAGEAAPAPSRTQVSRGAEMRYGLVQINNALM